MTFFDCTFTNNNAINGAAIYNNNSQITFISDNSFTDNEAENAGVIYNAYGLSLFFYCNLTNNVATNYGGAIYNTNGGNLSLFNSNLINNEATNRQDGAIYKTYSTILISNSAINNNTGEGIFNTENGTADIINNEISDNGGSGIVNDGDATINDKILSNNGGVDETVNTTTALGSRNTLSYTTNISITTSVSSNRITIKATVKNNRGNLLVDQTVNFYINGELVGTGITDNNSVAEFVYVASKIGTYNVLVSISEFTETDTFGIKIYSAANTTTSATITTILGNDTPLVQKQLLILESV